MPVLTNVNSFILHSISVVERQNAVPSQWNMHSQFGIERICIEWERKPSPEPGEAVRGRDYGFSSAVSLIFLIEEVWSKN